MKRGKFIINSAITGAEGLKNLESIIGCLILNQIVDHVDVNYTTDKQEAMSVAAGIKPGEYDFVTAVGGDGTVHDVINGVIMSGTRTPVAIIPTGTSNSFAHMLELPADRTNFCKMIKRMRTQDVSMGKMNDRYFLNSVVGGFLTKGVAGASQQSKAVFGKLAYLMGAAKVMRKIDDKSSLIRYESKEFSGVVDTSVFVVKNCFGTLAGEKLMEPARQEGKLEVLIIEKAGMLDIPAILMKFMHGTNVRSHGVKSFMTSAIDISLEEGSAFSLEFDKEQFGKLPVHLEPVKDAFRIIVP